MHHTFLEINLLREAQRFAEKEIDRQQQDVIASFCRSAIQTIPAGKFFELLLGTGSLAPYPSAGIIFDLRQKNFVPRPLSADKVEPFLLP